MGGPLANKFHLLQVDEEVQVSTDTTSKEQLGPCKYQTRGMLLLTKAKRPLKFKMLCGFNKHAVKLRMHKAAPYAFPLPVNTF